MNNRQWLAILCLAGATILLPEARAQVRPYIGFAYPAGGQQGTTFQIRLGGQAVDDAEAVEISGKGVTGKVVKVLRRLNNQEMQLLREQVKELKRGKAADKAPAMAMMSSDSEMMMSGNEGTAAGKGKKDGVGGSLLQKAEQRLADYVQTPACASIANLVIVEVTIAPDAEPGDRDLRLVTLRGVSNPLVFQVGQLPEISRKPMVTANLQVLGKEASALRKRPPEEVEQRVTLPCTFNGQIASGEINKYRFEARKGQRLVFATHARHLIPFVADAVPGWFQPVLALHDNQGKEVAFADDYRSNPDPVIFYEVPQDGEYALVIYDSIYRGREDFVYRISAGELPFVTSIFPLGGRVGEAGTIKVSGWNVGEAELSLPDNAAPAGTYTVTARNKKLVSNPLPFVLDSLPETLEIEGNDTQPRAQKVPLPIMINGRVDKKGDWDVFRFQAKAGDTLVAEVSARRLASPLDSVIKLTDAGGRVLSLNDDCEDPGAGINTHPADSFLSAELPSDGAYYLHIGDTARQGGPEYAYRLRLSTPQPDFALRVVPSSVSLRGKSANQLSLHLVRKDGFTGPIKVRLKNPPEGFSANPVTISGTQTVARLSLKSSLAALDDPVSLTIEGTATIQGSEVAHQAVPAEDRMQAFLWRHLVPAKDLKVLVFDPSYQPPLKRVLPVIPTPEIETNAVVATANETTAKPAFSKQQIAGRLRQLNALFEEGLLTDEFYGEKVAECRAAE